ncbi:MAG: type I-E CRISPR-associated protein Cse1/CasA [Magnetococcales bacterium]|nr:type I-E CRISPR-associated protein Cse1/CasA [Magnetococcales bacterium]
MYNLMTDPVIRVGTATGAIEDRSLPGVLAGLVRDEILSFSALQPHQSHAWHAFLVQLAAMALHQAENPPLPGDEAGWQQLLRGLTPDWPNDEPWQLVVEDLQHPAFLQPPVPEGNLTGFNKHYAQPDQIDVLLTAKNHDLKTGRIQSPRPDHWILALVSLQTMEGYSGALNYGIARMNGAYGSRPGVGIRPNPLPGSHFRHDLALLQRYRDQIPEEYPDLYRAPSGTALLWLLPWDGQTSLSLERLDPYFIEICRRMRLTSRSARLGAFKATSEAARIAAKEFNGVLGDPWTPLCADTSLSVKSLSVKVKGFDYPLVANLLLGSEEYRPAPAQSDRQTGSPGEMEFLARALSRGKGITEGYHERRVPLPARVRAWIGQPEQRQSLAAVAKQRVEECGVMDKKVLKPAILTMIQEAPDKLNFQDRRADPWLARLNQQIDDAFFPALWRTLDQSVEQAKQEWQALLRTLATATLEEAKKSLIGGGARRYKTFAAADRTFYGSLYKQFPALRNHAGAATDEENP